MLASFRSRLVLSNLLITLLGLLVVAFIFTQLLTQLSISQKRGELKAQSQGFAQGMHDLYQRGGSPTDLTNQVFSASRLLHERIVITSPTGAIIIDSAHATPFYKGVLKGKHVDALQCGHLVCLQQKILGTHGHLNGGNVLIVAQPDDLRPSSEALKGVILVAAASALLVWLLIGSYSTYSLFRPLLRITRATERIAKGDYAVRVGTRGQGEIRRLASSFDAMVQQVQQSNQVLKDFLGNVSHDLRTPLTMIAGFSQALLDGTAGPEGLEESATVIHDEALKMQRLVDDLLRLTRLESGLYTLERHPVEVRSLVQGIVDRASHGRESGPSLGNAVPTSIPLVNVDPDQLERAVRNLVDNALVYTPADGKVAVSARQLDTGWVEISVSDTGDGIAPADVPRVFERFYRSDKGRERAQGHSGLGLAIVREIIEAHGGTVRAESRLGRGSIFCLTVPVVADTTPMAGPARHEEQAPAWEGAP